MKKVIYILMIVLFLPFFVGCDKNNTQKGNLEGYTNCTTEEKNTEFCNLNYLPVCGDNGETYGNKCFACASKNLNSYKTGECNCDAENGICSVGNGEYNEKLQEENNEKIINVPMPNF